MIAEVTLLQSYVNNSSTFIEGKYTFPVDPLAAVTGFEAFINKKHIVGVVKPKEEVITCFLVQSKLVF